MNKICKIVINDYVHMKFEGLDISTRKKLVDEVTYFMPHARFSPSYRLGRWNGKVSLCNIGGSTYINLLSRLLPIIEESGYSCELYDNREHFEPILEEVDENYLSAYRWPEGHRLAGEQIKLHEYQIEAINVYLKNHQSIQSLPTGLGKCLGYYTELIIYQNNVMRSITIGDLFDNLIEQGYKIDYEKEVDISKLNIQIPTPHGNRRINYCIKKRTNGIRLHLNNSILECAENHILYQHGKEILAKDIKPESIIDANKGYKSVLKSELIGEGDYYDIGIDYPHKFLDKNGIIHHNTIVSVALSKKFEQYGKTLVIVPTKDLVLQTEEDYKLCDMDVGVFFGDRKEYGRTHTISTWQSLLRSDKKSKDIITENDVREIVKDVKCIIADEVHQYSSKDIMTLFTGLLKNVPIRYGMTGTIPKEDILRVNIECAIGEVVNTIKTVELQDCGILSNCFINIEQAIDNVKFSSYTDEVDYISTSDELNRMWANRIREISKTGNTLILVSRKAAGKKLLELLPEAKFLSGENKTKERKSEYKLINSDDNKILICTFGIASTGINIPRIFNLILINAGKSFKRTIQSVGRGLRRAEDKDMVNIFDFCTNHKSSSSHLSDRKRFYKEAGYPFKIMKKKLGV